MRQIKKGIPAKSITDFVRKNRNAVWGQLPPKDRHEATEALVKEQHSLDGYTERRLRSDDWNTHIDHFRKRDLFPQLTFDWENLIWAEHSTEFGADAKDNYSECRAKDKVDYQNIVDPVHDDPHDFFSYLTDGEIVPKAGLDDTKRKKAQYTIDCFCLNNISLRQGRCVVIEAIKNLKKGNCDPKDILEYLKEYNFPSVLEYFCSSEIFVVL